MSSFAASLMPAYGIAPAADWITATSTANQLQQSAIAVQTAALNLSAAPPDAATLAAASLGLIDQPIPASILSPSDPVSIAFSPLVLPQAQVYTPPAAPDIAPLIQYYIPPVEPLPADVGATYKDPIFDPTTQTLMLPDGTSLTPADLPGGGNYSEWTLEQKNSLDGNLRLLLDNLILMQTGAVTIPVQLPGGDFANVITPVNLEPSGGYTLHLPADVIPTGDPITPGIDVAAVTGAGGAVSFFKGTGGKIVLGIAGLSGIAWLVKKL